MVKVLPPPRRNIPDPPLGTVWNLWPFHYLWLEDPEYYDQMGRDPLQQAKIWTIINSDQRAEKLREVVKEYPKQRHRRSMLFEAARRGDTTLVRCLVQTGLRVHPNIPTAREKENDNSEEDKVGMTPDKDNPVVTPVHEAASLGHLACVRIFIEEANVEIDTQDDFGCTPLIAAHDQLETVRYLLEKGAEPTIRTINDDGPKTTPVRQHTGSNVLECSASRGNTDVLKILLDHPSFSLIKDWLTPLAIKNAAKGSFESLKLLLERGEYPIRDKDGTSKGELLNEEQRKNIVDATPTAACGGDLESLKLLLSYQFPINDNGDFPSFEIPEDWHNSFIDGIYNAMIFNQPEKFEFLNSFGLKEHESMSLDGVPEGQKVNIQHLFEKSVESGSIDCARLMIEKYGADPNRHRLPPGWKPLYIGALRNKTEMLRYLLDNYDIDIHLGSGRYSTGPTALWGAVHLKSLDCIALLLRRGGPVDHIDEEVRNIEGPLTAILRGTDPSPGSRPMVFLETEEHAQEHIKCVHLNPRYVRLELGLEDKEWLNALQLRKGNEELRETGDVARELNEQEGVDNDSLSDNQRKRMTLTPTFKDRETELMKDDDLLPEFIPAFEGGSGLVRGFYT